MIKLIACLIYTIHVEFHVFLLDQARERDIRHSPEPKDRWYKRDLPPILPVFSHFPFIRAVFYVVFLGRVNWKAFIYQLNEGREEVALVIAQFRLRSLTSAMGASSTFGEVWALICSDINERM